MGRLPHCRLQISFALVILHRGHRAELAAGSGDVADHVVDHHRVILRNDRCIRIIILL